MKVIFNYATRQFEPMEPSMRERFALGGGVIQGEKVGDRENFAKPTKGYGVITSGLKAKILNGLLTYEELIEQLKTGKTTTEIAEDLINKNSKLVNELYPPKTRFDGVKISSQANLTQALFNVAKIEQNVDYNSETLKLKNQLQTLINKNRFNFNKKQEKTRNKILKDVKIFVKKNKNKYLSDYKKGAVGTPLKFYNDVIKHIEKTYPKFVKTSEKGTTKVTAGTKFIDFGQGMSKGGAYPNFLIVNKEIDAALGIRKSKPTSNFIKQGNIDYKNAINKLIPIAQQKGYLPKNTLTGLPINNWSRYNDYVRQTLTDPLKKIFGNLIYFSPEHPGGVLKLVNQLDSETLFRVVPMQSLKEEGVPKSKAPNLQKGAQYDSRISSALRDARATDDIKIIKKRVGDANKFSKLASEQYGVAQAKYEVKIVDGKPKIITKYPSLTLGSSMLSKTKAAIHNFIANGGIDKSSFKKLPEKLKKAIKLIDDGKNANVVLKSHIKDVIPEYEKVKNIKLPSFSGAIDASNISPELLNKIGNAAKKIVPVLKGLGYTTGPLQTIPFIQQAERGLPLKETLITGTARLVEDTLNLPKTITNLFGGDLPYEATFGRRLSDKIEESIPLEERQERIRQFEIPRGVVDDMELLSDQKFDKMSEVNPEKFKRLIEESESPQIEESENEKDISKPPQSFFTPLPTDKIVGEVDDQVAGALMDSFPNQSFLQYQSAVDDGFQGSFEEYLQQQSMKLAQGGRVGFANGSPNPMEEMATLKQAIASTKGGTELKNQFLYDTSPIGKLDKSIFGKDGDRNLMQQFNTQFLDPRSYPYYAQKTIRGAANIPELAVRFPLAAAYLFGKGSLALQTGDLSKFSMEDLRTAMEILEPKFTKLALDGTLGDVLGLSSKAIQAVEEKRAPSQKATGDLLQFGAEAVGPATPYFAVKALQKIFPKLPKQIKDLVGSTTAIDKVNKEIEKRTAVEGVDQTRRDIILATGAGGAVALLKLLGLDNLFKAAPKAVKATEEIVTKGGTPKYFFDFVSLIKSKGKDITDKASTLERQKVYSYNGYELTEDISTGKISIRKDTEGGASYSIGDGEFETVEGIVKKEEINYEPPETILDDAGKPKEVPDQYDEATLKPDAEGDLGDIDQGLDSIDEILDLLAKDGKKYTYKELSDMGLNLEGLGKDKLQKILKDPEFVDKIFKAVGGIIKLAGDDSGPPPKSGPTPHGLPYVAKNVRPIKERK